MSNRAEISAIQSGVANHNAGGVSAHGMNGFSFELENNPALALADKWQRNFPLDPRPFASIGKQNGLGETDVLSYMQKLSDDKILSRIGATVRPNTAGASTLAALAAPKERLKEVAEIVNKCAAVNHNYEREHDINLWFVVTAADRAEVLATLDFIADESGCEVLDLPLERAYHIDLGFSLASETGDKIMGAERQCRPVATEDRFLLLALQDGLELTEKPYQALANHLGWTQEAVLDRLGTLITNGIITRFGCILKHRNIGYRANAMSVWDVPDDQVDKIAAEMAKRKEVTLCYRRTRRKPTWPFNLFAMIHGQAREEVLAQIQKAEAETGLGAFPSAVLFSRHCFKQRGANLAPQLIPDR